MSPGAGRSAPRHWSRSRCSPGSTLECGPSGPWGHRVQKNSGAASLLALSSRREGLTGQAPEPGPGARWAVRCVFGQRRQRWATSWPPARPRRNARRPEAAASLRACPAALFPSLPPHPRSCRNSPPSPTSPSVASQGAAAQEAPTAPKACSDSSRETRPVEDLGAQGGKPGTGEPTVQAWLGGGVASVALR